MPNLSNQPLTKLARRASRPKPSALKDEVKRLETELSDSRRREEIARNALLSMHRELEDAHVRLGQQQEKLRVLVATLHTERFGFGPGIAGA